MTAGFQLRAARAQDIESLAGFIFEHGPNPWNFLPEAEVREHLGGIAEGRVQACLAEQAGHLAGFVTFYRCEAFAEDQDGTRGGLPRAYICEAVVHRELAGRGLGSRLLAAVVERLAAQGVGDVFIERHEENAGSAGMMRKAGFREVRTFDDPERRATGSRRTTLCHLRVG
ncbi:GNAT family N-acetyltransferase [Pseudomonas tohonis]|uniref:GNAT family N-acetyltransferase n=1 Tax=Pseudomonas tohonis TaxID=2725477 RepID=UPI0021D89ECA|nr:N-acetyltransferase [Pseudomonas tohonis]UXY54322.1 GNAT family N-acetyltransferase [Pseudomonas tohonis]